MQSKWTGVAVLLLLIFVVAVPLVASGGQSGFWMWFTPSVTPEGNMIGTLFYWVLGLCGVLFVGIHAIMIYFAVVYHEGNRESTSSTHGHLGVEVTWTVIPTLIMIFLGIYTFNVYANVIESPSEPLQVNVTAQQFSWKFEYPQHDLTLRNRLVLPSRNGIQFNIQSKDVLHSLFVPSFRMKQDAVPGITTRMNVSKITETGHYSVKCAELCGVGHYRMSADLYVITLQQFKEWLAKPGQDQRSNYLKKVLSDA